MHCHQHQSGHCLSTLTIDQDQRQTSQIPINYLLHVVPCQRLGQKPSIICCLNHPILTQKNNHTTPTHGILIKCSFLPNLPIRRPQHTTYTSHYSVFAQSLSLHFNGHFSVFLHNAQYIIFPHAYHYKPYSKSKFNVML